MQLQNPYGPHGNGTDRMAQPAQPGGPYYPQQPATSAPYGPPGQPTQQPSAGQPPIPQYVPPASGRFTPAAGNDMPPPPPAATTPYDFFLDPPKPDRRSARIPGSMSTLSGSGKTRKIVLAVCAILAVGVITTVVMALLPKDKTGPEWFALAQRQQEIIRICTQGSKATSQSTRNFAITCQTSLTTSQSQLKAYMQKNKMDYNDKKLGALADSKADSRLASATASSNFDSVFIEIASQDLTAYNRALATRLSATTGSNGRLVLTNSQTSIKLLAAMLNNSSTGSN